MADTIFSLMLKAGVSARAKEKGFSRAGDGLRRSHGSVKQVIYFRRKPRGFVIDVGLSFDDLNLMTKAIGYEMGRMIMDYAWRVESKLPDLSLVGQPGDDVKYLWLTQQSSPKVLADAVNEALHPVYDVLEQVNSPKSALSAFAIEEALYWPLRAKLHYVIQEDKEALQSLLRLQEILKLPMEKMLDDYELPRLSRLLA